MPRDRCVPATVSTAWGIRFIQGLLVDDLVHYTGENLDCVESHDPEQPRERSED